MADLHEIAPSFVEMAHQIVWCTVSTVDSSDRPRSRVLHPLWEWQDGELTGWILTGATPAKRAHLARSPHVACNYWTPSHDTCLAECHAEWVADLDTKTRIWNLFREAPEPLGYDPGGIGVPGWTGPDAPTVALLRLRPWRLRVLPGENLAKGVPATSWRA
ncbi:pyridoxamine 5'-phosphate oxidase family protein [Kutzneria viridogrisea]|uniref:Pyridoxamine 5'-phosphate oxidase n=1 Tax=Kutzneria viridogrisea TaxID=47990 RepID=A0ABR6BF32_9PSEU|nr:hypothetical protein [Kutzneria viridogrisea]